MNRLTSPSAHTVRGIGGRGAQRPHEGRDHGARALLGEGAESRDVLDDDRSLALMRSSVTATSLAHVTCEYTGWGRHSSWM